MVSKSTTPRKTVKAVGLISGGLDSILAARIVKDAGVKVWGIYFSMPWGGGNVERVCRLTSNLNIHFNIIQLKEDYFEVLRNPRYGFGSAFNPCVDCHIFMLRKAAGLMKEIKADFVFTGEVLGQRPMSQRKECLGWVEKGSGLQGRLLRPLSAQLLEPTHAEQQGLIDRGLFLGLSGRSRKEQMALAKKWKIEGFATPAGGCLLTDQYFSNRLKDVLIHGIDDFQQTIVLRWGRYVRLNENFYALVGRDQRENGLLIRHARPSDYLLELDEDRPGPTVLLRGKNPSEEILREAGHLVLKFSKFKNDKFLKVSFWQAGQNDTSKRLISLQSS